MSERRSCLHHCQQQQHARQAFEEKYWVLEDELKQKNDTIVTHKNDIVLSHQKNDSPYSTSISTEKSLFRVNSQRANIRSTWNVLTKDREIAKLKALIFQKDNELIALASTNKNTLIQMEERLERERKVWNEHKDLLLASERVKFEEEKTRLLKDLQEQLKIEQERCQRLEQKLYDAQMQTSEAQLMLKESGRERINAVYGTKEQCRKEFQDEIARLRSQFQLEKDTELTRVDERIRQLENALDQVSTENNDASLQQHELFLTLEISEKNCVRTINDCIKKLLMAMNSPPHAFTKIPHSTSFKYDRDAIIERSATRSLLKLLQETSDEIRNYIVEQQVQIETKTKVLKKSKVLTDRKVDYSNRTYKDDRNGSSPSAKPSSFPNHQKENDCYFRDINRLCQTHENGHPPRSSTNSSKPFQFSPEQNHTIDNLVQKLEDHIASELNRLTKERLTLDHSYLHDGRSTSFHFEPPKKVKFEPVPSNNNNNSCSEEKQDIFLRHLKDRIGDLRDDKTRLRDNQQSKSTFSLLQETDNRNSFTSTRSHDYSTTQ